MFWSVCLSILWAFYSIGNAVADDRIPVALAYFENTSQDPALEPLKKGLVDMLEQCKTTTLFQVQPVTDLNSDFYNTADSQQPLASG